MCLCVHVLNEPKGFPNYRSRLISGSWNQLNGLTVSKKNEIESEYNLTEDIRTHCPQSG